MASFVWNNNLDPRVEILQNQRIMISQCIYAIRNEIDDFRKNGNHIKVNGLLDQLEQLCEMNFMFEEQLVEELDSLSVPKHQHLHEQFVRAIDDFKKYFNKSYTPFVLTNFFGLKMAFVKCMTDETDLFCKVLDHYSGSDTAVTNH